MKKKTLVPVLGTIIIGLGSVVGCGSTSSDSNTLTVHFWHTFGHDVASAVTKVSNSFTKIVKEKEGIDVKIELEYQGGYDDMVSKVEKSFSAGTTPTIAVAYPDHVARYLKDEDKKGDFVVPLDDYINNTTYGFGVTDAYDETGGAVSDIVPSFYEEGQQYVYEGTYSLPLMKSTEIMLYNKDVVDIVLSDYNTKNNTNIKMNTINWTDFMAVLNYINDNRAKYNFTGEKQIPLFYDSDSNLFIGQSFQRGIDFISMKDGVGSADFNNDSAKAMVNEFKTMYDNKLLKTKGTNDSEYGSNYFTAGDTLFVVGSTGGSGYSDPGASFNVGVCKFPMYKDATVEHQEYVSQGVSACMLKNGKLTAEQNSKSLEYGFKFVKYFMSAQNNLDVALSSNGYVPVRSSCYELSDFKEFVASGDYLSNVYNIVVNDIAGKYFNYPVFSGSDTARSEVGGIITNVLLGKSTTDNAFTTAYSNTIKMMA
jgi:multiple sugar transport system substrate-binding protein